MRTHTQSRVHQTGCVEAASLGLVSRRHALKHHLLAQDVAVSAAGNCCNTLPAPCMCSQSACSIACCQPHSSGMLQRLPQLGSCAGCGRECCGQVPLHAVSTQRGACAATAGRHHPRGTHQDHHPAQVWQLAAAHLARIQLDQHPARPATQTLARARVMRCYCWDACTSSPCSSSSSSSRRRSSTLLAVQAVLCTAGHWQPPAKPVSGHQSQCAACSLTSRQFACAPAVVKHAYLPGHCFTSTAPLTTWVESQCGVAGQCDGQASGLQAARACDPAHSTPSTAWHRPCRRPHRATEASRRCAIWQPCPPCAAWCCLAGKPDSGRPQQPCAETASPCRCAQIALMLALHVVQAASCVSHAAHSWATPVACSADDGDLLPTSAAAVQACTCR